MHYAIVIAIIVVIVCFQVYSYGDTVKKIRRYKSIFPKSVSAYSLRELFLKNEKEEAETIEDDDLPATYDEEDAEDDGVTVSQVHIDGASPTLMETSVS